MLKVIAIEISNSSVCTEGGSAVYSCVRHGNVLIYVFDVTPT